MHRFVATISKRLAKALNRMRSAPSAAERRRVLQDAQTSGHAQLAEWESEGGTVAPPPEAR